MIEFESTFDEQPPTVELCVVYDQRDGRIVHMHGFVGDGKTGIFGPDAREERERTALDLAKRGGESEHLRVMHAPPSFRLEPEVLHRVDVASGQLEPIRVAGTSAQERAGRSQALRRPGS